MINLRLHYIWMVFLFLGLTAWVGSRPLITALQDYFSHRVESLNIEDLEEKTRLQNLREDAAMAAKLHQTMDADAITAVLAPTDRLQLASLLERQATASRLTHLTYSLSPEQQDEKAAPDVVLSTLNLSALAPDDRAIIYFLQALESDMPGKIRLKTLQMERLSSYSTVEGIENIKLTATFDWLTNRSAKERQP